MNVGSILFLASALIASGCCTQGASEKERTASTDSTSTIVTRTDTTVHRVTSIALSATVESVTLIDSIRFTLTVRITGNSPQGEEGIASGQTIDLVPAYAAAANSPIDLTYSRNRKLHVLRSLRPGALLNAVVIPGAGRRWQIVDYQ